MNKQEFERIKAILAEAGIDRLYHVTDLSNWTSLKESNGLRSIRSLHNRDVKPSCGCGDTVSRMVDQHYGLDDYIHLSFSRDIPAADAATEAGFLRERICLEISLEALLDYDTLFSSGAPSAKSTRIGPDFHSLIEPHIGAPSLSKAEALVKSFIPLGSILNRAEIEETIQEMRMADAMPRSAILFLVDESMSMGRSIILYGKDEPTISGAVGRWINGFIVRLLQRAKRDPSFRTCYDIAVVGYGDGFRDIWSPGLPFAGFVPTETLLDYAVTRGHLPEEIVWVSPSYDNFESEMSDAFSRVRSMVDEWLSGKGNQVTPPVIVHITDAEKLGMHSRGTIRIAKDLMSIETKLGVAEVWNMQYTPFDSHRMVLPTEEDTAGLDAHGHFLFQMSSPVLPAVSPYVQAILPDWTQNSQEAERRALFVNCDMSALEKKIGI